MSLLQRVERAQQAIRASEAMAALDEDAAVPDVEAVEASTTGLSLVAIPVDVPVPADDSFPVSPNTGNVIRRAWLDAAANPGARGSAARGPAPIAGRGRRRLP